MKIQTQKRLGTVKTRFYIIEMYISCKTVLGLQQQMAMVWHGADFFTL